MKKLIITMATAALFSSTSALAQQSAAVQADIDAFQGYFLKTFPNLSLQDFSKGPYAMSDDKMMQFEAIMEMPPFEDLLEKGGDLWNKPFANGHTFSSCWKVSDAEIRTLYPRWNAAKGKVETLEQGLIDCLVSNGEKKWGTGKGKHAWVASHLTTLAEGQVINVVVPEGDAAALAAYNDGKRFYWAKRGQLNLSCANCHVGGAGKRVRGNTLSPALGQSTHFPVWRGKWAKSKGDGFGTMQRRYGGCNKQVRAKPFKRHKSQYDNLEFYHTAMSNGMEISGTEYRE
ncbi:MAG TPA: sulfur oxidation c-type cytochrome SoxA [Candidatus Thioglobus sp.]|jgi:sulfur-oxidizing protein SoxA|nr:sulfur oxidation c-type cytochrome SoxA [Candidatus Thioglobus sp.]HIL42189.1 sulfur oxidation c-type cytochrome SoxA [Gammaproteobacteria bacterium]